MSACFVTASRDFCIRMVHRGIWNSPPLIADKIALGKKKKGKKETVMRERGSAQNVKFQKCQLRKETRS